MLMTSPIRHQTLPEMLPTQPRSISKMRQPLEKVPTSLWRQKRKLVQCQCYLYEQLQYFTGSIPYSTQKAVQHHIHPSPSRSKMAYFVLFFSRLSRAAVTPRVDSFLSYPILKSSGTLLLNSWWRRVSGIPKTMKVKTKKQLRLNTRKYFVLSTCLFFLLKFVVIVCYMYHYYI